MGEQLVFGRVVHPPFVDRLVPDAQNRAWDDLGPRNPVGVCQHSMLGTLWGTDGWFRRGAASRSLTDYGVGGSTDGEALDGVIFRWNDPRGRSATVPIDGQPMRVSANRAGWANGGTDGLEGDGPAFVRTLGIAAVNRDLVSIERSDGGVVGTPVSARQLDSICALTAYWFDQARVPWDRFPFNPAAGVVTHMLHREFAKKACPFSQVNSRIGEIQERVRQILKAAQTGDGAQPGQDGASAWPNGYDEAGLADRFGTLVRRNPDGTETRFRFDPKGPVSNAWVARGASEGLPLLDLPTAQTWWVLRDGPTSMDMVTFENRWTLYRPDRHVSWRWL